MLKKWNLLYITWRWWHVPMQHGKTIGYCTAYAMYNECALGMVAPQWKVEKPMTGPQFQDRLAEQQCEYRTRNLKYPGNKQFNKYTQLSTAQKERRIDALEQAKGGKTHVMYDVWEANKYPRCRSETS